MVRVFTQGEDRISIAGQEFTLKALPSRKAVRLTDMAGTATELWDKMADELESLEANEFDKLGELAKRVFAVRYYLLAWGLDVPIKVSEDGEEFTKEFERLRAAIDEASFREIFWAIDQVLEINGAKHVEALVKNLISRLENKLPDLQNELSAWLKRFSEREDLQDRLVELKVKARESIGSMESSLPSQESPTTLTQNMSEAS